MDDFSRYCVTYLLKKKSETHEMLNKYIGMVNNKFERKPKALRTDNGGECHLDHIQVFLKEQGILHRRTIPHTPEQNRIARRNLSSLLETT